MRRPAQFTALLQAPRAQAVRLSGALVALTAAFSAPPPPGQPAQARFGFTVGKRLARRSVDRSAVRRVLREAARHQAAQFDPLAQARGRMLDLNLRLKSAWLPSPAMAASGHGARKAVLRAEADRLLQLAARRLAALPVVPPLADTP